MKDHEKFFAFLALGFSLVGFGVLIYLHPLADSNTNSGVLQILNMIIGALIGAFGAAVSSLLKASADTVKGDNPPSDPVNTSPFAAPVEPTAPVTPAEELPDYAR